MLELQILFHETFKMVGSILRPLVNFDLFSCASSQAGQVQTEVINSNWRLGAADEILAQRHLKF